MLGQVSAFKIFLLGNGGLADCGFTTNQIGFNRTDDDSLVLGVLLQSGRIQLAQFVPFFDDRAFGNQCQDGSSATPSTLYLAFDFVIATAFDFALFQDDMIERAFLHFMKQRIIVRGCVHARPFGLPPCVTTYSANGRRYYQKNDCFDSASPEMGSLALLN